MKSYSICALAALFGSFANAAPVNKRDVVWVTEMEVDTVTIPVTETVWVDFPGSTQEAVVHHHTYTSAAATTTAETTESTTSASVAPTTPSSTAVSVAPTTSAYVAPTTSTTSAYVAPTTSTTSAYVAPTTSTTSAYVAPTTTSTSEYVAPTTTEAATSAYVAPTTSTSAAAAASTTASSSSSSSGSYTGQLSFYAPGLGSCGIENSDTDYTVALAEDMMTASWSGNPNDNPLCNSKIAITYNGKTVNALITDTCPGCTGANLDLTPGLWAELDGYTGSLDETTMIADTVGILKGATWSYV